MRLTMIIALAAGLFAGPGEASSITARVEIQKDRTPRVIVPGMVINFVGQKMDSLRFVDSERRCWKISLEQGMQPGEYLREAYPLPQNECWRGGY